MAIPAPIYFLIREHAKSLVAIKELRERMKATEEFQGSFATAFQNIQQKIVCDHECRKAPRNRTKYTINEIVQQVPPTCGSGHFRSSSLKLGKPHCFSSVHPSSDILNNVSADSKVRLTMESDNKQDSGLDSDCRDHGQDSSLTLVTDTFNMVCAKREKSQSDSNMLEADDELTALLDIINQKGLMLRKQLDNLSEEHNTKDKDYLMKYQHDMLSTHETKRNIEMKLKQVEKEKKSLCDKVMQLEVACQELESERKWLEERLEIALLEKHHLELRIHGLYVQYVKTDCSETYQCPDDRIAGLGFSTKNSQPEKLVESKTVLTKANSQLKIPSILNETNILELQRQLITCIMENEVLHAKVHQLEEIQNERGEGLGKKFRSDMKQLQDEKEELYITLQANKIELETVQAKVVMLENALQALTQENKELNKQLGESLEQFTAYPRYKQLCRPTLTSQLSKTYPESQSLPVFLAVDNRNPTLNSSQISGNQNVKKTNSFSSSTFLETQPEDVRHYDIITSMQHRLSLSSHHSLDSGAQTPPLCTSNHHTTIALSDVNNSNSPQDFDTLLCSSPVHYKSFETQPILEKEGFVHQNRISFPISQFKDVYNNQTISFNNNVVENLDQIIHSKQVDSICSEFDPLHNSTFQGDPLRQQEFIDSLDLSIPLKPVKSSQENRRDMPFPRSAAAYLCQQRLNLTKDWKLDSGVEKPFETKQIAFQIAGEKNSKNLQHQLQSLLDRLSAAASDEAVL
ncbi:uncharacterized protein LOC106478810 isoform X2 [Limulus polyphemus]|nr:uncharacterized protein LOC106478810 isoform X2 [Limulus polyphemus]